MKLVALRVCFLSAFAAGVLAAGEAPSPKGAGWDAKAAGSYLDGRITWWMNWPGLRVIMGRFASPHTEVTVDGSEQ